MPEPEKVEDPVTQGEDASTSGEGGKQGEETFPSVQAQLDELRPLVNARLQEGTTWWEVQRADYWDVWTELINRM